MEEEQDGMKVNGKKNKRNRMWKVRNESWRRENGVEMKIIREMMTGGGEL
jgi:ribosomal protein L32E